MTDEYKDIINLPHHVSPTRPHMSMMDRAAQFAPYAALRGHSSAIDETARLTSEKMELGIEQLEWVNICLNQITESISERPFVTVTYFEKDSRKSGGRYTTYTGNVKKVDNVEQKLVFTDRFEISFEDIWNIESETLDKIMDW